MSRLQPRPTRLFVLRLGRSRLPMATGEVGVMYRNLLGIVGLWWALADWANVWRPSDAGRRRKFALH